VKQAAFACALATWLACFADTVTAMTIYVLDSTYTSQTLEVEPSDSIDNVKQKTQDRTGIDPASQYLYFGGTLLQEGYTLSDYSIGRGSTLPLVATAAFTSTPLPNVIWNFGVNDMTAGAGIGWTLWQTAGAVVTGDFVNEAAFTQSGNSLLLQLPGTSVPEPSTCIMALAGLACGGYLVRRRRRTR
jgi:hypothetical protein